MKLIIAILFLNLSIGFGQITESDTLAFGWKLGLNGSNISGNVERTLIISNLDISSVGSNLAYRGSLNYQFGTFGKFTTENDVFLRNFVYYSPKKNNYPYLMFWYESNLRRKIQNRYQLGLGASLKLIKTKNHFLKLSTTYSYEISEFDFPIKIDEKSILNYDTQRLTLRAFGQNNINKGLAKFNYEFWFQQSVFDIEDYRANLEANIEFQLYKLLKFKTGLSSHYENITVENVVRFDSIIFFGLTISNN